MQSAWRVIDCTQMHGRLRYVRGRLLVCPDNEEPAQIPLTQIAVILLGQHATCSTALLFEFAEHGISTMLCDWRGVPVGAMHSWGNTPTFVSRRQHAQVSMSLPRQKNAWMQIVKAKIRGQAHCLDICERSGGNELRELAKTVHSGDSTNVEGQAARKYWQYLFDESEDFHRKPGAGEGRNSQFDYAYAVLRGFVVKAIFSAGLSPTFGVNHHNRANYFCLADDLIEPYRPAIDAQIANLDIQDSTLNQESKAALVHAVNAQFNAGLTIPSSINDFAQQFGLYCESKQRALSVPVFGADDEEG
ncbi:type II CRISPR-associated endonuclease Cas1 [Bifidobacterium canis]|nr:type II CRISPR-associated endonuclease Cas1 [Bifidobacterium canis]